MESENEVKEEVEEYLPPQDCSNWHPIYQEGFSRTTYYTEEI